MRPEGPGEALLNTMTTRCADGPDPVEQAISEMTAAQRDRLERRARQEGMTPQQMLVRIVELTLRAEAH